MRPILYGYFRSSCSYRVRMALNYKNIDFEYRAVNLKDGSEQLQDDFISLNPRGEVPYFSHGGIGLSQSMAIIQYIDRLWSKSPLFPKNDVDYCKCMELCEMINTGIQPIQNLAVIKYVINTFDRTSDERVHWSKHWIEKGFQALEAKLSDCAGTYSVGDEISACDLFLVPQVYNALRFKIDMGQFPIINRVYTNCMKLDWVEASAPENQPDCTGL